MTNTTSIRTPISCWYLHERQLDARNGLVGLLHVNVQFQVLPLQGCLTHPFVHGNGNVLDKLTDACSITFRCT
jgi:hypothetical protein